jgi:DNA-binding NarL/FixJ family response regulator
MPIKIIVADDEKLFRKGFVSILSRYEDIDIIAEAANGDECIRILQQSKPDIVLLDINMPRISGYEVLQFINNEHIDTKVIVVSMADDEKTILDCIEAGAMGVFSKNDEYDNIYAAIKNVVDGIFFHTEQTKAALLYSARNKKKLLHDHLSFNERELAIIQCLCKEMTSEEIAKVVHCSQQSLNRIRQDLIHRVGARNTTGLILYSIRNGLVKLSHG